MQVTDIKQQIKRPDRYSLYVDAKYAFSLSESALLSSGLHIGVELSKEDLKTFKDTSRRDKAYNQALSQIARRQRSEWEVRDYLKRKEYDPELAQEIINRLYQNRFLDDEAFARAWVENRRLLKSTSQRRLTMELRQKRVSDDIIKRVLDDDETDERQVLRELVARKRKQTRYQDSQKLLAYLMRQGFGYDDVKSVMAELENNLN